MELKINPTKQISVNIDLLIEDTDYTFLLDVNRRMGKIAMMKVIRYRYPFLTLRQAMDLSEAIKLSEPKE